MARTAGVAVAGIGETENYKRGASPYGEFELALLATLNACSDAGLDPKDIDGFASSVTMPTTARSWPRRSA